MIVETACKDRLLKAEGFIALLGNVADLPDQQKQGTTAYVRLWSDTVHIGYGDNLLNLVPACGRTREYRSPTQAVCSQERSFLIRLLTFTLRP